MIQRVGRVNRVDTQFDTIFTYNFFPTEQSNDLLKLKEAAEAKIQAFIEMLGADARLLTEGEEIKSHDLFEKLTAKETITGENESEESELEYLKIIRDVRDNDSALFTHIKRLPRKARTAKLQQDIERNGLLTYFRKGNLEKFYATSNGSARELDFLQTAKLLSCESGTGGKFVGPDFYSLLDRNKEAFVIATSEESEDDPLSGGSRDNSVKILTRLRTREVKRFEKFTDEDGDFLVQVTKLLEDGALPKPTTRKVWDTIKNESNPLKILGGLKRHIPPQFFQATRAAQSRHNNKPREVILSAYLISEEA
jgi:hypothetical protein